MVRGPGGFRDADGAEEGTAGLSTPHRPYSGARPVHVLHTRGLQIAKNDP